MSKHDEPTPVGWMATQAGYPQDYPLCCARTISLKSIDIKNPLLAKLGQDGQDGWILASLIFCKLLDQNRPSKKQY